jgi:hypothetical protein
VQVTDHQCAHPLLEREGDDLLCCLVGLADTATIAPQLDAASPVTPPASGADLAPFGRATSRLCLTCPLILWVEIALSADRRQSGLGTCAGCWDRGQRVMAEIGRELEGL